MYRIFSFLIKLFSVSKKRKKFMYFFVTFFVQAKKVKKTKKSDKYKFTLKSEQSVISSLNHAATIATVAGSFTPQDFSGRFILLLKV